MIDPLPLLVLVLLFIAICGVYLLILMHPKRKRK